MKKEKLEFYGGPYAALIPILFYVFLSFIFVLVLHVSGMEAMEIAIFIGVLLGFLLSKNRAMYWDTLVDGLGNPKNARLVFVFLMIGVFSKLLVAGKVGQGLVWLAMICHIHGAAFTVFSFVGTALLALGSGMPFGALFSAIACFFIPGILLGCNPLVLIGSIIGGVYCGDSFAPSSQVTAVALSVSTNSKTGETADLNKMLKERSPWMILATIITIILLFIFGGNGVQKNNLQALRHFADPRGLIMLLAIALVVFLCLKTKDILFSLTWSTLFGTVIGLLFKVFPFQAVISFHPKAQLPVNGFLAQGIQTMTPLIINCIFVFGMIATLQRSGCFKQICTSLTKHKFIQSPIGAETVTAVGMGIVNTLMAGGDVPAILLFGNIADDLGHVAKIEPERRAYFLIGVATSIFGIIPLNSSYIMSSLTLLRQMKINFPMIPNLAPVPIFFATFFCWALTAIWLCWIIFGLGRKFEGDTEVNTQIKKRRFKPTKGCGF